MRTLAVLLIAFGCGPSIASAGIVYTAEPDSFPDGTDISTVFPGLTLSTANDWFPLGGVYARDDSLNLFSTGTTSFGRSPTLLLTWGGPAIPARTHLRGDFASPTRFLQLDFISNEQFPVNWDVGFLEIFDSGQNSLGAFTTGNLHGYGTVGTISITRPTADIAFFTATGSPARGDDLGLDNLQYELGDGPPPVPIPEPLSLLVWAMVLLAGVLCSTVRQNTT